MTQLQAAALPEIKRMMQLNPLSSYAAWSPRQIAGSNPAYEQLFAQANQMGPALGGLNYLFGGPTAQGGTDGMAIPNMSGGSGTATGSGGTTPGAPPQFQPLDMQQIINEQVAAGMSPAIQQAVNQAAPPRNSIQGNTFYDMYGNPHPFDSINGLSGMPGYSLSPNSNNTGWQVIDPNGSMVATS